MLLVALVLGLAVVVSLFTGLDIRIPLAGIVILSFGAGLRRKRGTGKTLDPGHAHAGALFDTSSGNTRDDGAAAQRQVRRLLDGIEQQTQRLARGHRDSAAG